MQETFKRTGWWWQSMGFTKMHLAGVFVTESLLLAIAVGFVLFSFVVQDDWKSLQCVLVAICIMLVQIGVLLSSILSLLFYAGSSLDLLVRGIDESQSENKSVQTG